MKFKIPIISLTQYALDLKKNLDNIIESIKLCKNKGILYRPCIELEITGFSCHDHFFELSLINKHYEVIAKILGEKDLDNIVIELGGMLLLDTELYNVIYVIHNHKILYIRPKSILANDGNYREKRYFKNFKNKHKKIIKLPKILKKATGDKECKFGMFHVLLNGLLIGQSICKELWGDKAIINNNFKDKCKVNFHCNASEYEIGKEKRRLNAVNHLDVNDNYFVYNNLNGYDGDRNIFDGGSFIYNNGKIVKQLRKLGFWDVALDYLEIDYEPDYDITGDNIVKIEIFEQKNTYKINYYSFFLPFKPKNKFQLTSKAISVYLYTYLKYSGTSGFILPLSGGSDSACVAGLIYYLSNKLFNIIDLKYTNNNEDNYYYREIMVDKLYKILQVNEFKSPKDILNKLLVTIYLPTNNSSKISYNLSNNLAKVINSEHYNININDIYDTCKATIEKIFSKEYNFISKGGTLGEDLTLQNLQARIRLMFTYLIAQSICCTEKRKNNSLIVLATGNLDEIAVGYFTKYDCSSGDLSPIGNLNKIDVKDLIKYFYQKYNISEFNDIYLDIPRAELRPETEDYKQLDEDDIGLTYDEIKKYTKDFIKNKKFFENFSDERFIIYIKKYVINRHKSTVLPPSLHLNRNNLDDNRYNLRPIVYPNIDSMANF